MGKSEWHKSPIGLWVNPEEYQLIYDRRKTIEVCMGNAVLDHAEAGDMLYFQSGRHGDGYLIECRVTAIGRAATLEDALLDCEWWRAYPGESDFDQALHCLETRYHHDVVREHGAVIIDFVGLQEIVGTLARFR